MNKVILMGRLTKDPEVRYSQGQQPMAIARYTIAIDEARQNQDGSRDTNFIQCVAFGKLAEFAEKYMHQGRRYLVCGRWKTGSYTNKDGQKVYTNECFIESQEFADSNDGSGQQRSPQNNQQYGQPGYGQQPYGQQGYQPAPPPQEPQYRQQSINDGFMNIPDDVDDEGLPFN